jgi:PKD repeat protein
VTSAVQSGVPGLPEIGALPLNRKASYTDADRRKTASAFDPALPSNGVSDAGAGKLTFAALADGSDTLTDYAFALYSFVLPGYADDAVVQLNWDVAPADGTAWVALANRDTLRWDWQDATLGVPLNFGMLLPYIEADNLTLAMIVGGSQAARLTSIVLGTNALPAPFVTVSPDNGTVPLTVDFSGAQSTDSDGTIVKYEWDFDDDGVYDLDSGTDATVSHTYTDVGSYTPRMRVTDDKGAQARDGENVSVNPPGMVPPVAVLTGTPQTGPLPLEVTFDAAGSSDDVGIENYDFDFNGDGSYEVLDSLNPTASTTYSSGGIRTAVVRVEDSDGATDTASFQVDADAIAEVDLNGITPLCGLGQRTLSASGYEAGGQIVQYRWDFDGDGTWDQTTTTNQVTHDFSWGVYSPRVEVTDDDGDTATDEFGIPVQVVSVASSTLPAGDGPHAGPGVAVIGGSNVGVFELSSGLHYFGPNPHYISTTVDPPDTSVVKLGFTQSGADQLPYVVYYSAGGDLRIARATANPDATADWTTHNIRNSSSSFDGDFTLDAATYTVGGTQRIAVSYYDAEDNELGFALSSTSSPDETADWTVHSVDDSGNAGKYHALAILTSRPALVYQDISVTTAIKYARSSVEGPDNAADWGFHTVFNSAGTNDPFRGFALRRIGAVPAFTVVQDGGVKLKYFRATVSEPTALNQWHEHEPLGTIPVGTYTGLGELDGLAGIAYTATNVANPILNFAWAEDTTPSNAADWCLTDLPGLSGIYGFHLAMTVHQDKPLIGLHTDILTSSQQTLVWGQ